MYAGRNQGHAVLPPNLPPLTEVHVPRPEVRVFPWEKLVWRGFRHISRNMFDYDAQAKYYGNWCGNRLAVTIYVNTKTLLFSHSKKRRFV